MPFKSFRVSEDDSVSLLVGAAKALAPSLGKKVLEKAAPKLWGRLSKGKSETAVQVAQIVSDVAGDALGLSEDASEAELDEAISKDPAAAARVRVAAIAHATEALKANMHYATLEVQDRQDARALRSERDGKARLQLVWIALAENLVILGAIMGVIFLEPPLAEMGIALLGAAQGAAANKLKQAYDYWLGTSNGSDRKNDLLGERSP